MIEIRNLTSGYAGKMIVKNASMNVPDGAVTVMTGPNGSGKSTLLMTAAGLIETQKGGILVDGSQLGVLTPRQRAQRITYLAQSRNVPSITACRLVLHGRFPYLSYPRRYVAADREAAMAALERMGVAELADMQMPHLSGGQRQRIYLAMALAQDTGNLLMDEPTTYLDVSHQLDVMQMARELAASGRAVCMVLHDLCLAMKVADQIVVLDEGTVQAAGRPDQIYDSGVLQRVFGVGVSRFHTQDGWQYYYLQQ